MAEEMLFYSMGLNVQEKPCVVVGGGRVALRKIDRLLRAGAQVAVVSPELHEGLEMFKHEGRLIHHQRSYQCGDLVGAYLAFAATNNAEVNRQVWLEACAEGLLVNVVDDPALCSFIVPASMEIGPLQISVSTSGIDPRGAKNIRDALVETLRAQDNPFANAVLSFIGSLQ